MDDLLSAAARAVSRALPQPGEHGEKVRSAMDGDVLTMDEAGLAYECLDELNAAAKAVQDALLPLVEEDPERIAHNQEVMEKAVTMKERWEEVDKILGWRKR